MGDNTTSTRGTTTTGAGEVLVATTDGIHRLDLTGARASDPILAGRRVTSLAVDPDDDRTLWALVDKAELHRITTGISTGTATGGAEPTAELPTTELTAKLGDGSGSCVHVHQGEVFVGGHRARLWKGLDLEPVSSFDQAPTHEDWHTPWGGPPDIFSMASMGNDLYVGIHVGGILVTSDGGATWRDTIDLHDDVHQVVTDPPRGRAGSGGTVWAATGASGLGLSIDRGHTWRYLTEGLHATYLLAVAVSRRGVLVGASAGHADKSGAIYLLETGPDLADAAESAAAAAFRRAEGLPDRFDGAVAPQQLAAAGDHAAVALPGGTIHVSDDGGLGWRLAPHQPAEAASGPEITQVVMRSG